MLSDSKYRALLTLFRTDGTHGHQAKFIAHLQQFARYLSDVAANIEINPFNFIARVGWVAAVHLDYLNEHLAG